MQEESGGQAQSTTGLARPNHVQEHLHTNDAEASNSDYGAQRGDFKIQQDFKREEEGG